MKPLRASAPLRENSPMRLAALRSALLLLGLAIAIFAFVRLARPVPPYEFLEHAHFENAVVLDWATKRNYRLAGTPLDVAYAAQRELGPKGWAYTVSDQPDGEWLLDHDEEFIKIRKAEGGGPDAVLVQVTNPSTWLDRAMHFLRFHPSPRR